MDNFTLKIQPLFIDFHSDNRYGKAYIEDKFGNRQKTIILDVSYKYIVFNLGEEFLDNNARMQEWLNSQIESIFEEYKTKPEIFENEKIIKIFRNKDVHRVWV